MVVAIVILGVVIAPIAFAARSAINFVPDAGDRSAIAIARSRMVDRFSEDAATATSMDATLASFCPTTVQGTASTSTMFTFKRNYGTATTSSAKWIIEYKAGTAFIGRTGDMWPVRVYREYRADETAVSPTETTTFYTAYCKRGDGVTWLSGLTHVAIKVKPGGSVSGVAQSVGQHQTANLVLGMYESVNDTATTNITFNAVQRETCTDTVNGCP
jgi:hypothetical protein